ncbi:MAG: 1,4-dihydroxy-2-naphthoate polyprenyltransferase [Deltaproteobacteria bacterium]|nr:1,4-dihydroxy-2-naphthoate polyprenyltransferase [Deltaproteobacteria bacterium]
MTSALPEVSPTRRADSLWRAWWLAARPATLWAAAVPVLVGTSVAVALSGFRLVAAVAALLGALSIQVGTNFANDVFDFEKGADDEDRLGPTRAVQSGLLTPRDMRAGMLCAFSVATVFGSILVFVASPWVILIGVVSIAMGIAYTAGPYPLAYVGLGDIFVFVFFGGVAVAGSVYVQMGEVPALALWASVPVGALSTAILAVNNLRDRETDARARKLTLAVRFGSTFAKTEYVALVVLAYAVPVGLVAVGQLSLFGLLPFLSAPLAVRGVRDVLTLKGRPLNETLARTGQLLLAYGSLFSIGVNL